jgi:hypothetical protein
MQSGKATLFFMDISDIVPVDEANYELFSEGRTSKMIEDAFKQWAIDREEGRYMLTTSNGAACGTKRERNKPSPFVAGDAKADQLKKKAGVPKKAVIKKEASKKDKPKKDITKPKKPSPKHEVNAIKKPAANKAKKVDSDEDGKLQGDTVQLQEVTTGVTPKYPVSNEPVLVLDPDTAEWLQGCVIQWSASSGLYQVAVTPKAGGAPSVRQNYNESFIKKPTPEIPQTVHNHMTAAAHAVAQFPSAAAPQFMFTLQHCQQAAPPIPQFQPPATDTNAAMFQHYLEYKRLTEPAHPQAAAHSTPSPAQNNMLAMALASMISNSLNK